MSRFAASSPCASVPALRRASPLLVSVACASIWASAAGALPRFHAAYYEHWGIGAPSVAVADVNGDGRADVIAGGEAPAPAGALSLYIGHGDGVFDTAVSLPANSYPSVVRAGDVDGDGAVDLVAANDVGGTSATISVLRGHGDGGFDAAVAYPCGAQPTWFALADLDADGDLDVATPMSGSDSVCVLLNDGAGHFSVPVTYQVGAGPNAIAVADIDGDGHVDLVVADVAGQALTVLHGAAGGNFGARTDIALTGSANDVALGDLDNDGWLDAVVAETANPPSGKVAVLRGSAAGFGAPVDFAVSGTRTWSVGLGDMNRDGVLDIAASGAEAAGVSILLGDGAGGVAETRVFAPACKVVLVADLNADGSPDVVGGTETSANFFLGQGNGNLGDGLSLTAARGVEAIAAGDMNGDGHADLVVVNALTALATTYLGHGDGTYASAGDYPSGASPHSVTLGDLNGDGHLDALVTNGAANTFSVLRGTGTGAFQPPTSIHVAQGPWSAALADLNGDGKLDAVVAHYSSSGMWLLLGNGDGTFTFRQAIGTGLQPRSVAVADLNGDGRPDIVTANASASAKSISVFLGKGDGSVFPRTDYPTNLGTTGVALADVTGDGAIDAVVSGTNVIYGQDTDGVSVLPGTTAGGFGAPLVLGTGVLNDAVATGDIDGDGRPDVLATNGDATLSAWTSAGGSVFAPLHEFAVGGNPDGIATADVNGDGRLDVIVSSYDAPQIVTLLNTGGGYPVAAGSPDAGAAAGALGVRVTAGAVTFDLRAPHAGAATLRLYDLRGRWVATPFSGTVTPEPRAWQWQARDARGRRLAAGLYVAELRAGSTLLRTRVLLAP